ncbi:Z1 domain-containing protein [Rhodospirillales bacterium]|nr:Z1 domain-containing protein [Rhodospirillales bacterium]
MSILEKLINDAERNCYLKRLKFLKQKNIDTSLIDDGINQVTRNLDKGAKSLVIYGEPQSGKTEFMIALTCKLVDVGKKTIFVITNDNTELEVQNFNRFKSATQLNPTPMKMQEFLDLPDEDKKAKNQRIIFCRKNKSNLEKLIKEVRFLEDRVVIDDEADYASPNTKINKQELTTINQLVGELGELPPNGGGIYIGVTATPGRLDLNNTFLNDSKDWVFLKSHDTYKGREFFFPFNTSQNTNNFILQKLPDTGDDPKPLKEAFLRFLVRVSILNLKDGIKEDPDAYSMLIHTDGKVNSHIKDMKEVQKHISIIINQKQEKIESYLEYMLAESRKIIDRDLLNFDPYEVLQFIIDNIGRHSVLIINSKNDKENVDTACNPKDIFTFAIGGNIVSRGLTFKNLLTFFFSRGVKGKMQQNTYIQRARMFGVRPYHKYFELAVPDKLFEDWATCFYDHEISLRSAKIGDYSHFFSSENRPADSASIDKSNTSIGHTEWKVGKIFDLNPGVERVLWEKNKQKPLDALVSIMDQGLIPNEAFDKGMLNFIKETSSDNQSEISIVWGPENQFIYPNTYNDFIEDTLARTRGGLIAATIRNRSQFDNKYHLIMPVKNASGKAVIWYKNLLGKRTLKNFSYQK